MEAYLNGGLWLRLAAQANASAAKLAAGLAATPKFRLAFLAKPTKSSPSARRSNSKRRARPARGSTIGRRGRSGAGEQLAEGELLVRLVCSFETAEEEVEKFLWADGAGVSGRLSPASNFARRGGS